MHVTKTQSSDTHLKLEVEVNGDDIAPIKTRVVKKLARQVKVPGFRPGKTPLQVAEKHIEQSMLQSEVVEEVINQFYTQALQAEKVRPAAQPEIMLQAFVPFTELRFVAELEIIGPIKLADYKKIRKPEPKVEIKAGDIDEVIKALQNRMATRKEAAKPAAESDEVWIDFEGFDKDGKPIEGAKGSDYPLILGSKSFIPGFEENLVSFSAGDKTEFEVVFPKDYPAKELQNKPITFKVTIQKVQEVVEPPVDEAFVKEVGPFQSVKELREDIEKTLSAERQQQVRQNYQQEVVREVVDKSAVKIPDSLIDEETERVQLDERRDLNMRGVTWEEHLKEEGMEEDEHTTKRLRPEAERRLKTSIILSEIAEVEDVQVSDEEFREYVVGLKQRYHGDEQIEIELAKPENQRSLALKLLSDKVIATLADFASKS